ncbi:MAG: FecR domain-containing protein [Armatimonadetes bacterium]|nr:FecR domain-containing protein [Armatimonadota bacterium]
MSKRAWILVVTAAALWVAIGSSPSWSGTDDILVINYRWSDGRQGKVDSKIVGTETWEPIFQSRVLGYGDRARTHKSSVAQCRITSTMVAVLGPDTEVEMEQLAEDTNTKRVRLLRGAVKSRVERREGHRYQVVTPRAVLSARGTSWLTHYGSMESPPEEAGGGEGSGSAPGGDWNLGSAAGETRAVIIEHTVHVQTEKAEANVDAGHTVAVDPEGNIQIDPPFFVATPASGPNGTKFLEVSTPDGTLRLEVPPEVREEAPPIERSEGYASDPGDVDAGIGGTLINPNAGTASAVDAGGLPPCSGGCGYP